MLRTRSTKSDYGLTYCRAFVGKLIFRYTDIVLLNELKNYTLQTVEITKYILIF